MPYRGTKSLSQNASGIPMAARLFLFAYLRLCAVLLNSMLQNQGFITTDTLCFSLPFVYLQIAFISYALSTSLQFRSKENNGLRPAVFYVYFLFMKLQNRKNKQNTSTSLFLKRPINLGRAFSGL